MIDRILALMKERGVNAVRMTADLGLSHSAVTDWKKGKAKPSVDAITKIADYFGVTIDYLLGRVDHPNVTVIPADPEKVKAREEQMNKQRDENIRQFALAAAKGFNLPTDTPAAALATRMMNLSPENFARAMDHLEMLEKLDKLDKE